MKPNFALTLSFDGIGLLHRVQGGWHLVGEVKLDTADLTADLAELATKARALNPTGLRTKIIIPDEQIKYMAFETAERDVSKIEALVRKALDGATPYALRELSWDWSVRGNVVHVAAVARETLVEAEQFATEHNFNPLCFVAMPDEASFAAEPFFGETKYAARVLGPDEVIDRETEVIRVIGAAHLPEPEPVPPEAAPGPVADIPPVDAPVESAPPPAPQPPPAPAESVTEKTGKDTAPAADQTTDKTAGETGAPEPETALAVGTPDTGDTRGQDSKKHKAKAGKTGSPEKAVAFASSRDHDTPPPLDGASRDVPLPKARFSAPPAVKKPRPDTQPKLTVPKAPPSGTPAEPVAAAPVPAPAAPSAPPATKPPREKPGKSAGAAIGAFLSRRGTARAKVPDIAAPLPPVSQSTTPEPQPLASSGTLNEAQRMTVFGARRNEDTPTHQPRYMALILTALLLLFLVAVAAWSALKLDNGVAGLFRSSEPAQIASDDTAPEDEPVTALPAEESGASAITRPPPLPRAEAVTDELPADEVRARYAATGIWQLAPQPPEAPGTTSRRDIYRTGTDEQPRFAALKGMPGADALMPSPLPPSPGVPPPAQARFDLDERGFIAATPDGVVTPDGITVIAGAPPITPPPTPPRASAVVLDDPAAAAPEAPEIRPRLRPASVTGRAAGADGAGDDEATTTDPQDDIERALREATEESSATSLRPRLRPASFAARVEQARQAAAAEPVHADQQMSIPIPSTASVARAATEANQISLRKVNLIGVYGSPGDRRALIRLANGRYRKVEVGDRVDGGQVAAIGDDELHYVKRGRTVVLKMPRG